MPQRSPDDGIQPFELRTGLAIGRLRGMNRQADPASTPANQFHLLTNVRLTPNGLRERPGLSEQFDTGVETCITALFELEQNVGLLLELGVDYSPAPWSDARRIGVLDEQATAAPFRLVFDGPALGMDLYPAAPVPLPPNREAWMTAIRFRGRWLALGTWLDWDNVAQDVLFEVHIPTVTDEQTSLSVYAKLAPTGAKQLVMSMVVRTERNVLGELEDILYLGTSDGQILRYDGATLSVELAAPTGAEAFVVRLCVVAGLGILALMTPGTGDASTDAFARWQASPGGAWSTVTVPTGLDPTGLIAYGVGAYVFDATGDVYLFDPNGTPQFDDIATLTSAGFLPFVYNGALWVVQEDA